MPISSWLLSCAPPRPDTPSSSMHTEASCKPQKAVWPVSTGATFVLTSRPHDNLHFFSPDVYTYFWTLPLSSLSSSPVVRVDLSCRPFMRGSQFPSACKARSLRLLRGRDGGKTDFDSIASMLRPKVDFRRLDARRARDSCGLSLNLLGTSLYQRRQLRWEMASRI